MDERRRTLRRFEHPNHLRFITFSTYHFVPLMRNPLVADLMVECIDRSRKRHGFHLFAFAVMPEHVHLLMWPRLPGSTCGQALKTMKLSFVTRAVARWKELKAPVLDRLRDPQGRLCAWQRGGGYDRNIHSDEERLEKMEYIHNNPVNAGLVKRAVDYRWSSASWYSDERSRALLAMDPSVRPA